MIDWSRYPNFSEAELRCKHTGKCEMDQHFMDKLQALRNSYGAPINVTSGYRDRTHPAEARKGAMASTGAHTFGKAVDIAIRGADARTVVGLAIAAGFSGIGLKQHGDKRFIHLDTMEGSPQQPRPWIWTYQ